MSSTRDVTAPPVFAENATTTIPEVPLAGVAYRDEVAGPASAPNGWPFQEIVNSAHWNQLVYQWSKLLSIIDAKGVLGWTDKRVYDEPAIVFGSDGALYMWVSPSGPGVGGGPKDPTNSPAFWVKMPKGLASQAEAESGSNADKAMTSLGVTQLLQATAARATTTKYGAMRKATAAEVVAGSAVDAAVTPDLLKDAVVARANTATKLQTARTIGGVAFDGTANINLPGVNIAGNQNTSGNAATATKLQTPRTINGVNFDGSANISISAPANGGTSAACSGNAATATKLQTARTINGVAFDGTKNITITAAATTASVLTALAAATFGAVGTVAFLRVTNVSTSITAGSTYAGSALRTTGVVNQISTEGDLFGAGDGVAVSGTWRAMGSCAASGNPRYPSTVFLRIS